MILRRLTVAMAVTALTLTACSSGDQPPSAGGRATVGKTSDVNPQDPATLAQGGALRLPLPSYPENFNVLHVDGNNDSTFPVSRPAFPRSFKIGADGSKTVNTDYFTSIELTGTNPQVVTYTINPKAVWSDGAPITWEDIKSQVNALSTKDKAYLIGAPNGCDRVGSVTRGVDDRQAIMTFAKPYADWKGIFAGSGILLPKSVTSTPAAFNKGFLDAPPPSAGPFIITGLDKTAQRVTLTRNPKWWGTPPVLDSITYLVLDDAARMPALQNNAIDGAGLGTLDQLNIARNTPGIAVRRAPGLAWSHLTFNGAPGSILSDVALRRAVAKGIDRQAIASITERGLADDPVPLNNHVFVAGEEGYQDNSQDVAFDPEAAKRELDGLGWRMNGQFREKDGRPLTLRDVMYEAQINRQIGQIAQNNLAQIGVKLNLDVKPGTGFFSQYIIPGDFDIGQFAWGGDPFPFSSLNQIYQTTGDSNFGKIGSPEIDAKIEAAVEELDPAKALDRANELDKALFAEVFSLPLTQTPGNVAVRSNLANFGAPGLSDVDYTAIGFMKPS